MASSIDKIMFQGNSGSNNTEFLNAYNRLDNYLKSISGAPRGNMIPYLEKILPEKQQSELRTIRNYKNMIESHGVNPGYKKPTIPKEWIKWLEEEIEYCKLHKDRIAAGLKKALAERENNRQQGHGNRDKTQIDYGIDRHYGSSSTERKNDRQQGHGNRNKTRIDYGITNHYGSSSAEMIAQAVSAKNFERAVEKGGVHKDLLDAVIDSINDWYDGDLRAILAEYGSNKKPIGHRALVKEVAKLLITTQSRSDLLKIIK